MITFLIGYGIFHAFSFVYVVAKAKTLSVLDLIGYLIIAPLCSVPDFIMWLGSIKIK